MEKKARGFVPKLKKKTAREGMVMRQQLYTYHSRNKMLNGIPRLTTFLISRRLPR